MMTNEDLSKPIEIQSSYIVPDILPTNFSETYRRIVLSGADDMAKVAGRANEAGAEAFDAQKRKDLVKPNKQLLSMALSWLTMKSG